MAPSPAVRLLATLLSVLVCAACLPPGTSSRVDASEGDFRPGAGLSYSDLAELPLQEQAQLVAAQYDVPSDLLLALAWMSTTLSPLVREHGESSPVSDWLGLRPAQIESAAALTGLSTESIGNDSAAALLAAAALLDSNRNQVAPEASGLAADARWWPVIERWPALAEPWLDQEFAFSVFEVLQRGLAVTAANGDPVAIAPRELPGLAEIELLPTPADAAARDSASHGYPGAHRFVAASPSNYSNRPSGLSSIDMVVIHTTEGSYSGSISWFRNPASGVSAHYVIRKSDGEVTQMVSDERRAWHAGTANDRSIGIEHEGAAANAATWTPQILESSARLGAWLSERYNIPIDRDHFIGHSEVHSSSRSDPGSHFPWSDYIDLVKCYRYGGSHCSVAGGVGSDASDSDCSGSGAPPGGPGGPAGSPGSDSGGDSSDSSEGSSDDGTSPGEAWVRIVEPRSGDQVRNPVWLRAVRSGGPWVELWAGAFKLGASTTDNPADASAEFFFTGNRTLTARLYSNSGVLLDIDTLSVQVLSARGEMTVYPSAVGDSTWSFTADVSEVTRPVEFVTYSVEGETLEDDSTGTQRATGPSFELRHSFVDNPSGRLLVARAFDSDARLLASASAILDADAEPAAAQCTLVGTLACGDRIDGNTELAPDAGNSLDAYPDLPGNYSGPELGYQLELSGASEVEVRLLDPHPFIVNHDLILLDGTTGLCLADDYLEVGFNSLQFDADPGHSYIVVVDGYDGAAGAFVLEVECY